MSKIAYFQLPAHGHVNPTLPVTQELVRRGEEVIYYNTKEFRPQSERTGATFRAYPETELSAATISELLEDGNLANITALLLRSTENLLPFTLAELEHVQPDLVLLDATAMWAKMAATILHLPAAATIPHFIFDGVYGLRKVPRPFFQLVHWLPLVPKIVWRRFRLIRRYGTEVFPPMSPLFPMRGGLNISFTARGLHPKSPVIDDTFRFVGPSINPQTRDEEFPLDLLGDDPLIYISLGTVHRAQTGFYRQCFSTFAAYPAQFVLSAGRQTDIEALGPIPDNFIVCAVVPQLEILQRTHLFITHGGMNSIHEGLYYGVPLILIPHQLEQYYGALTIRAHGAGLVIDDQINHGRIATVNLRQAVDTVLSQPHYRIAAHKVRQMLHATGGYQAAADEIQAYLART